MQEVDNIEEALKRMEIGKYDSCRSCGGRIRPDRLKVVPCAVRCRACQEKQNIGKSRVNTGIKYI
jgi:RNA polymerase-binding transcription factor DksA